MGVGFWILDEKMWMDDGGEKKTDPHRTTLSRQLDWIFGVLHMSNQDTWMFALAYSLYVSPGFSSKIIPKTCDLQFSGIWEASRLNPRPFFYFNVYIRVYILLHKSHCGLKHKCAFPCQHTRHTATSNNSCP